MWKGTTLMRSLFVASFIGLCVCLAAPAAQAEGKLGYVDSFRIRNEFNEFAEAQKQFDEEVAVWQAELDSLRQELEADAEEFQRQRLILSEEAKQRREDELRQAEQAFQQRTNQVFGPNGQAEQLNSDLVEPILEKINAVLEKVAIENNYDYIFDAVNGNIAYAKKEFDLTDKVLEELNRLE